MRSQVPSHCSHYMCRRTDIAPYLYAVLGATFARWLCPVHAPDTGGGVRASGVRPLVVTTPQEPRKSGAVDEHGHDAPDVLTSPADERNRP